MYIFLAAFGKYSVLFRSRLLFSPLSTKTDIQPVVTILGF